MEFTIAKRLLIFFLFLFFTLLVIFFSVFFHYHTIRHSAASSKRPSPSSDDRRLPLSGAVRAGAEDLQLRRGSLCDEASRGDEPEDALLRPPRQGSRGGALTFPNVRQYDEPAERGLCGHFQGMCKYVW